MFCAQILANVAIVQYYKCRTLQQGVATFSRIVNYGACVRMCLFSQLVGGAQKLNHRCVILLESNGVTISSQNQLTKVTKQ